MCIDFHLLNRCFLGFVFVASLSFLFGCSKSDQDILDFCISDLKESARGSTAYGELAALEQRTNIVQAMEVELVMENYSASVSRAAAIRVIFTSDGRSESLACIVPADWVS